MQKVIDERKLHPKEEWEAASNTWRLPYWDWGLKQRYPNDHEEQWKDFGLPYLFTMDQIPIYLPAQESHANPLLKFTNPEQDPKTGLPSAMGNKAVMGEYAIKDNVPYDPKDETLPVSAGAGQGGTF